ncbi:MAG: SpoIIE family protein phosphatase [Bacteroidia bacterium]|nr:SpoIIE family protein phosphatase [Bacteroidia bacterium]
MKKCILSLLTFLPLWAAPCESCGEDALCLGRCAYEALLQAQTNQEKHTASLILAHSWLKGDFTEGIPRLLYNILKDDAVEDSLRLHALLLLAQTHYKLGRSDSAALLYEQVIEKSSAHPFLRARAHLGLAGLLADRDLLRALGHAAEAAELADKLRVPLLTAITYTQLAFLTAEQRNLSQAITYAQQAIEAAQKARDAKQFHFLLSSPTAIYLAATANLASLYAETGRLKEAEALYQKVLTEARGDSLAFAQGIIGLSGLYFQQKAYAQAEKLLVGHKALFSRLPYSLRKEALRLQAQIHIAQNRLAPALELYEKLLQEAETHAMESHSARTEQLRLLSGIETQEMRLRSLEESRRQERKFYFILGGIGLVALGAMGFAVYGARRRATEERSFREIIATQSKRIEEQAHRLEKQNEELIRISETLAEALSTVQESHLAARRLQRAIMPDIERILPGSAIYYQPMHEVGGDFYAFTSNPQAARILFMLGDATGHGVSGAILAGIFVSTVQNLFQRDPFQSPQALLQALLRSTQAFLRTEEDSSPALPLREGAEIAIGIADFRTNKLHFGLAGRDVWLLGSEGLNILDGGRRDIGSYTPMDYEFPVYEEPLRKDVSIILFTDGLSGAINSSGRKLGIKAVRTQIETAEARSLSAEVLRDRLVEIYRSWKQNVEPNDDVTIMVIPTAALYAYAEKRFSVKA